MSDVQHVREVLRKIDDLNTKVRQATIDLRALREINTTISFTGGAVGRREVSKDLMPAITKAVDDQIHMWKVEIVNLENKVTLK